MNFTVTEYETIKKAIKELTGENIQTLTLNKIINSWENFIVQIEKGYVDSIYEYTNDLSVRNLIQKIIEKVPPEIKHKLLTKVKALDDKFLLITYEIDKPLGIGYNKQSEYWWYRLPINISEELEDDLKSQGFI